MIVMLQNKLLEQRTFWDIRFNTMQKKFQEKIAFLENKLSSNQNLWETMKMQDQRQKVLQQELGLTQKVAQQNEKLIGILQEEYQKSEKDKQILENL